MNVKSFGYTSLALAILVSSVMPLAYSLGNNINPVKLAFLAALVGAVGSLTLMLGAGKQKYLLEHTASIGRSLLPFAFIGVSFAAQTLIFAYTTHFISASLLAVVYRSWPLILVLIAPLMLRERITRNSLAAVAIGFAGMAAALLSRTSVSLPLSMLPFVGLVFVAAVLDAFTGVFQRNYKYELTTSLFLYNAFMLVALVPFAVLWGGSLFSGLGVGDILVVLTLGLIQGVILTLLFTSAFRTVKVGLVANASMIVPFITIVLAYLLLGQAIEPAYLLIAFSVAAGLVIQRFSPKVGNYVSRANRASGMPKLFDVTSAFANTKSSAVYDYIKANGKVVAFFTKPSDQETLEHYLKAVRAISDRASKCLILTNKTGGDVRDDEIKFMKSITGHDDDDLVVMAVGRAEDIEAYLDELHENMAKR